MKNSLSITEILRLGLLFLILYWSFNILKPFLLIIIWAVTLAVALYPLYKRWSTSFSLKMKKLSTLLFTLLVAGLIFVPAYFLVASLVDNTKVVVDQIQNEKFEIPKPDTSVQEWPLVGERLYKEWDDLSTSARDYAVTHKDFILDKGGDMLRSVGGFIGSLLAFVFSFLISVLFMFHADSGYKTGQQFMRKILGDSSDEILDMSRDTIRGVVKGILLVALLQTAFAFIGFKVIGLPAAGIFALAVLICAIVQVPVTLVMIPAIIIVFSTHDTTPAIIFTVYSLAVGMSDNILKPLLLGKGLKTPMIIILIGTIGGMLLHGIIGLFVGPVVLAVTHRIYIYWVNDGNAPQTISGD